jgi:hypothetical protein
VSSAPTLSEYTETANPLHSNKAPTTLSHSASSVVGIGRFQSRSLFCWYHGPMPLLSIWSSNREAVLKMTVEQVVNNAGDGHLRDGNEASEELRGYLRICPSDSLFQYARHCLENAFDKGGIVLQDIVNELGRRLDFDVENGLYQGKKTAVGFDGIWRSQSDPDILIEVKTTDYVAISLDKIAVYKDRLCADQRIKANASMLVVVGREDTGALEAQVRGSRYAWDMRLISVERLIKLVQIKEKSDDPATLTQIRQLLQPFEYTKIDRIIDVIFTTAADVEEQIVEQSPLDDSDKGRNSSKQERTDPELLNAKRLEAVEAFARLKQTELVRHSRTLFWSADKNLRVCCAVSKRYEGDYQPYWYAFHPNWDRFLAEGKDSYFVLSCMDRNEGYAVPYPLLDKNKKNLNTTEKGNKSYWHVATTTLEDGSLAINLSRIGEKLPLKTFAFGLNAASPPSG